jgi:cytoskeletal protein CcmA (bactofilin family)
MNRLYFMLKGLKSKVLGKPSPEMPESPAGPQATPAPIRRFRRLEDRSGSEDSVVSAQSAFKGEITGRAGVRIAGEMEGNIHSEGLVWIEETAKMKGDIFSAYVIVAGELEGDIGPSLHVELRAKARMAGNIQTQLLAIADGSFFEGQVNIPTPEAQPVRFAEKRQPGSSEN